MIAIHYQKGNNFSIYWEKYCEENNIPHKIVSCYDSNIIEQLNDCKALLWHINNFDYRDAIFAKYLVKSLENLPIKVFPDYNTLWHFDDKVAQKYLLESIDVPFIKTYVFYDKKTAIKWSKTTTFPKVFKLRKGSGSKNVRLVRNQKYATKLIKKAFGKGFKAISMWFFFTERIRKYRLGKDSLFGVFKGFIRLFIGTPYSRMAIRENGYIYFQDFIPKNEFDIRIIVIGNKAFGIKRMVRENDFRASGSGHILYEKEDLDINCAKAAFETSKKLNVQSMSYDFIYDENNKPLLVEISYAFNQLGYLDCPGYWDHNLNWHQGNFLPQNWMIEELIKQLDA